MRDRFHAVVRILPVGDVEVHETLTVRIGTSEFERWIDIDRADRLKHPETVGVLVIVRVEADIQDRDVEPGLPQRLLDRWQGLARHHLRGARAAGGPVERVDPGVDVFNDQGSGGCLHGRSPPSGVRSITCGSIWKRMFTVVPEPGSDSISMSP